MCGTQTFLLWQISVLCWIQSSVVSASGVNASSKLGGRSAEGVECRTGCSSPHQEHPLPTGGGVWEGANFLFCDLKMAYFCEFWGAKFKVFFFILSSSVGFGSSMWQILDFRAKEWIKDVIKCSHWARTTNNGLLYPNVRNNIGGDYLSSLFGRASSSSSSSSCWFNRNCQRQPYIRKLRLPEDTPAHQALQCHIDLSLGRLPDPSWRRCPGRPQNR